MHLVLIASHMINAMEQKIETSRLARVMTVAEDVGTIENFRGFEMATGECYLGDPRDTYSRGAVSLLHEAMAYAYFWAPSQSPWTCLLTG